MRMRARNCVTYHQCKSSKHHDQQNDHRGYQHLGGCREKQRGAEQLSFIINKCSFRVRQKLHYSNLMVCFVTSCLNINTSLEKTVWSPVHSYISYWVLNRFYHTIILINDKTCLIFMLYSYAKSVQLTVHGMWTIMRAAVSKCFLLRDKLALSSTGTLLI